MENKDDNVVETTPTQNSVSQESVSQESNKINNDVQTIKDYATKEDMKIIENAMNSMVDKINNIYSMQKSNNTNKEIIKDEDEIKY